MNDSTTPAVVEPHVAEPLMRILKIGTCPSLSGLSEITYQIGTAEIGTAMDGRSVSDISFRIHGNSNGGKYNPVWISIATIEKVLANIPPEQSFSAAVFNPIYIGGSSNSPGFLGSILLATGWIARAPDSRAYVRHTAAEILTEMRALIEAGTDLTPSPMEKPEGHSGAAALPTQSKAPKQSKKSAANV